MELSPGIAKILENQTWVRLPNENHPDNNYVKFKEKTTGHIIILDVSKSDKDIAKQVELIAQSYHSEFGTTNQPSFHQIDVGTALKLLAHAIHNYCEKSIVVKIVIENEDQSIFELPLDGVENLNRQIKEHAAQFNALDYAKDNLQSEADLPHIEKHLAMGQLIKQILTDLPQDLSQKEGD